MYYFPVKVDDGSDCNSSDQSQPFSDKFDICMNPVTKGCCQFQSISDQLSRVGIMISHEELRSQVVSLLANEPFTADNTHFKNFTTLSWDVYLHDMSNNSTYGDQLTLMAAAKLFDVQFVVVSSLGHQGTRFISNRSMHPSYDQHELVDYERPILFLGHYAESGSGLIKEHYVSLNWRGTSSLPEYIQSILHSSRPATMTTENSLEETHVCHLIPDSSDVSRTSKVNNKAEYLLTILMLKN